MPFKDTPFPDRSLMPEEFVVNDKLFSQFGEYPATLVYFSRGCIFKCSYCTYNVPRLLQTKSPKLIDEEIKYLKENYNIKGLLLKDEVAISPNLKVSKEILNTIEKNDIVWRGQTITIATLDQLKMARDSGAFNFNLAGGEDVGYCRNVCISMCFAAFYETPNMIPGSVVGFRQKREKQFRRKAYISQQ